MESDRNWELGIGRGWSLGIGSWELIRMTFLRLVRAGVLAATLATTALVSLGAEALSAKAAAQAPAGGRDASAEAVASYALTQQMPVDPEVALGTLPNGLKYYVRPNPRPARRVELRLVVKAGSVLEDPDQLGLAHFVEHM